jgi:glycosyltransferase involved in cell wall biosynthesis
MEVSAVRLVIPILSPLQFFLKTRIRLRRLPLKTKQGIIFILFVSGGALSRGSNDPGMNITFVLPFIEKTGGVLVVFEHALQLQKLGHTVRIYHPLIPYSDHFFAVPKWKRLYAMMRYGASTWRKRKNPAPWFPGHPELTLAPLIRGMYLPPADVVLATAWPTAYSVARLPASRGRKFYFIQHYETWTGNIPAIDRSFPLLGDGLITIAPWLTDLMKKKFGLNVAGEVHNGIDLGRFSPPESKPEDHIAILMMFHTAIYKGTGDGMAVLRRIREKYPDVRIRLFGQYEMEASEDGFEYHLHPEPDQLVELYRSSHIFLSPSLAEGWHLPPMEAMACGCAVVATRVGCIPVLDEGDNMITAEPGDVDALCQGIEALLMTPGRLRDISNKGLKTISRFTWPEKSSELAKILSNPVSPVAP